MTATTCPQCGASFECSPQPDQRCWCLDLPPLPLAELGKGASSCYCPDCLKAKLSSSLPLWGRAGVGASDGGTRCPHPHPPPAGEGVKTGEAGA